MNLILHSAVMSPERKSYAHLVIFGRQLIQALLNDMIPVQILNQHNNVHAEGDYDGVDLRVVTQISLLCSQVSLKQPRY